MLATNHALAGAVIGAHLPLQVAIPVAVASHFILDTIPHYGIEHNRRNHSKTYKWVVRADTVASLSINIPGLYFQKWAMMITGWIAWSPDIAWVILYFKNKRSLHIKTDNKFLRFHQRIQTERHWGILVEAALFAILLPLFIIAVKS